MQIALYHQFERLGVVPESVIGHSSGEIAAAYAAGYLNLKDAMIVAYYYGHVTSKKQLNGAMAAVNLSVDQVNGFLLDGCVVACENSPTSTTISGDADVVEHVMSAIKASNPDVSARKLRIDVAYHSRTLFSPYILTTISFTNIFPDHMMLLSEEYLRLLKNEGIVSSPGLRKPGATFVSTVTGKALDSSAVLGPEYWVSNMGSKVQFNSAVSSIFGAQSQDILFLEIGPHSTLAAPLRHICANSKASYNYVSSQTRGSDCESSFLSAVGRLWQESAIPNLAPLFPNGKALFGLPSYPWHYGHERSDEMIPTPDYSAPDISPKDKRDRIVAAATRVTSFQLPKDQQPDTELEIVLRALWSRVLYGLLRINVQDIGKSHSFLLLGGDSLTTIELVTLAFHHGIRLTATEVVQNPELAQMAAVATIDESDAVSQVMPFSLIPTVDITEVRKDCGLSADQEIEDIFPVTTLQEGFMALGMKQPGSYIHRQVYRLPAHVDVKRFRVVWKEIINRCGTLRSRIVLAGNRVVQAVIKEDNEWEQPLAGLGVRAYVNSARHIEMSYGQRLCRFALVEQDGNWYFVWLLHHAIFDGLTMRIVLDALYRAYNSTDLGVLGPYARFIAYTESLDSEAASEYWRTELHGARWAAFPAARLSSPSQDTIMRRTLPFNNLNSSFTTATILRAAWSIVLARYCDTNDICFGTTISGRQAPVPGLNEIPGPMIATVPVRVKLDSKNLCFRVP